MHAEFVIAIVSVFMRIKYKNEGLVTLAYLATIKIKHNRVAAMNAATN